MRVQITHNVQRGVAMVISLVMLLLVSIVVLQAARSSNLELLIGNNNQQSTTALMRAENSVAVGETFIETALPGSPARFNFRVKDGIYLDDEIELYTTDWSQYDTEVVGSGANQSEYVIEYIGPAVATGADIAMGTGGAGPPLLYLYRVSGRGNAGIGGSRVVQTIYATAD